MNRKVIATVLMLLAPSVFAAETVGGKIACQTKEWFDDFVKFAAAGDNESITAYMQEYRCFQLKDGMKVTVMNYPGVRGRLGGCLPGAEVLCPAGGDQN